MEINNTEEKDIREIIKIYNGIMGVIKKFEDILGVMLIAIISLIAFIILNGVFPVFRWTSIQLSGYGTVAMLPYLIFAIICIFVIYRILRLLKY